MSPGVNVIFLICDDGATVNVLLIMSADRIDRPIGTAMSCSKCFIVCVCVRTMTAGCVRMHA